MGIQSFRNNGSIQRSGPTLVATREYTRTSSQSEITSFDYSIGVTVKASLTLAAAEIGSRSVERSVTTTFAFSKSEEFTDTRSETLSEQIRCTVEAPAHTCTVGETSVIEITASVPYTMTFNSGRSFKGIWEGTAVSKETTIVNEYSVDDPRCDDGDCVDEDCRQSFSMLT